VVPQGLQSLAMRWPSQAGFRVVLPLLAQSARGPSFRHCRLHRFAPFRPSSIAAAVPAPAARVCLQGVGPFPAAAPRIQTVLAPLLSRPLGNRHLRVSRRLSAAGARADPIE